MSTLLALPAFMLGVLLIYLFAVKLQWLPATGQATWFHIGKGVVATPLSILLPIVTLAAGQLAVFARLLRSEMIITLRLEYIMVAKAKGISERRILVRHALRPSSFALVTVVGISIGTLVGGTIIVEAPGARSRAWANCWWCPSTSVTTWFVQGVVVLVSVAFVLANVAVDIMYAVLDPASAPAPAPRQEAAMTTMEPQAVDLPAGVADSERPPDPVRCHPQHRTGDHRGQAQDRCHLLALGHLARADGVLRHLRRHPAAGRHQQGGRQQPVRRIYTLAHPMGTETLGHDLFSQVVQGARISMIVQVCSREAPA